MDRLSVPPSNQVTKSTFPEEIDRQHETHPVKTPENGHTNAMATNWRLARASEVSEQVLTVKPGPAGENSESPPERESTKGGFSIVEDRGMEPRSVSFQPKEKRTR